MAHLGLAVSPVPLAARARAAAARLRSQARGARGRACGLVRQLRSGLASARQRLRPNARSYQLVPSRPAGPDTPTPARPGDELALAEGPAGTLTLSGTLSGSLCPFIGNLFVSCRG